MSGGDGITPDDVRYGNCGSSWLYLYNAGGGHAGFIFGADSTWGPIIHVSYSDRLDQLHSKQFWLARWIGLAVVEPLG